MDHTTSGGEAERLKAIQRLNVLDSAAEAEFDKLVELVATITGCPIGLVSIMGEHRQWFKARIGVDVTETQRNISFCTHTLDLGDLMVVEDARTDERFCNNPLVTGDLGVRFYAGVPFRSPDGFLVGTICVLDRQPRRLTPGQVSALRVVADKVAELMWLRAQRKEEQQLREAEQVQHNATIDRIGLELHEDYAQSIAACLKYIEMAQLDDDKASPSIQRTQKVLRDVLDRMRGLCNEISPAHFQMNDMRSA